MLRSVGLDGHKCCFDNLLFFEMVMVFMRRSICRLFIAVAFLGILLQPWIAEAEDLPISSPFGWRIHPITGEWKFHSGLDLAYELGTPVPAFFDGTIVSAGDFSDGYGNQVLIYHETMDCYTRYAHLYSVEVQPGMAVSAGYIIGYVGSTGNSTGPHLHIEYIIRSSDGGYEYADPLSLWN